MKQIFFATTNKGKVEDFNAILQKYEIEAVQSAIDLPEPRSDDVELIAIAKVLFAYEKLLKPCIALDGGFYVYSLKGFPKAFVNFALDTIDIEGILKLTENKDRSCEFRNCLAYLDQASSPPHLFSNTVKGTLALTPRGENREYGWGKLWFIFIPENETKTLAEMTPKEFSAWKEKRKEDSIAERFGKWFGQK